MISLYLAWKGAFREKVLLFIAIKKKFVGHSPHSILLFNRELGEDFYFHYTLKNEGKGCFYFMILLKSIEKTFVFTLWLAKKYRKDLIFTTLWKETCVLF